MVGAELGSTEREAMKKSSEMGISTRRSCSSSDMSLSTDSLLAQTSTRFCSLRKPRLAEMSTKYMPVASAKMVLFMPVNESKCRPATELNAGLRNWASKGMLTSIVRNEK